MLDAVELPKAITAKLRDIAFINPRLQEKPAMGDLVAFVSMSAVSAERALVIAEESRPYAEVAKGYTPFRNRDVLVAKITPCFENNKIAQANLSREVGFGSTEFHVIRPQNGKADARYLMHYLRQDHVRGEGERKMTGSAGQRRVPEHFLGDLDIPLSSLPEQRRIAAILDQADALRAKRRAALTHLDQMAKAIFEEMFGDESNIEQRWMMISLDQALSFLTSGSRGWASHYSREGDVFLRIQNICRDELHLEDVTYVKSPQTAEARRTRVQPGDVLLSITADLGRTAVVPDHIGAAYINQHLAILRQTRFNPRFLSRFLSSTNGQEQIKRRNKGGVKAGLNFDDVRSIQVPMPPRAMQDAYAERCAQLSQIQACSRADAHKLDALFASLQHRAFTGAL